MQSDTLTFSAETVQRIMQGVASGTHAFPANRATTHADGSVTVWQDATAPAAPRPSWLRRWLGPTDWRDAVRRQRALEAELGATHA
jgi:hypothetical protein